MEGESIVKLTSVWYQASRMAWLSHTFDPLRCYRNIYTSGMAFQTEGERRIHLPLLSRVKGLPNTGKFLWTSRLHTCVIKHIPCHLCFNTKRKDLEHKENEMYTVQNCQICSHMRLVKICIDMVTSEDTNIGITGLCPKIRINRRTCPQLDKGNLQICI